MTRRRVEDDEGARRNASQQGKDVAAGYERHLQECE